MLQPKKPTSKELEKLKRYNPALYKEVERNNKRSESTNKWNQHFEEEKEKAKAKEWVQNSMQEAYKHPLMSPGYFTPEGIAIGAMQGAVKMPGHIAEKDGWGVAGDAAMMLPFVKPVAKTLGKVLGTEEGLLSNAYKHNPWAFKPNESRWYRQVGESAINDAKTLKLVRENNEIVSPENWKTFQNQIKDLQGNPEITDHFERMKAQINAGRRPNAPFFQKGSLFYPMDRKPVLTSKNPAAKGSSDFLIESNLPNESFQPAYVKGMSVGVPKEVGTTAILKPDPNLRNIDNFKIYKKDWLQGYKKLQQGGYITQNNMNRYAQGGDLTQFNEGGLHSQNPLGGIPIGNNNSVEQGETKQNNFVYSNRIFLDSNIVSQYNLPKSLIGKSVADATKFIDNKFKGRNDKISQSTKNGMLSKIAEAQEAMKPQEPETEQGYSEESNQMWDGGETNKQKGLNLGFADSTIGQGFGEEATAEQKNAALGAGLGVATTALDLGMTAFGKPAQNTDGLAASVNVNKGSMIGGSALKGATAGMAFGPLGAGVGALVGAGAGLLGANKARKAATENSNNFALNTNNKLSDNYFAMGGKMNQMGDGGDYLKNNRPFYMTNPGPTTITPTIGKTGFYGPDRIPKQMFNDSTEPINIPEQVIKPTQTQAEFENYANQHQTIKPSFGQKVWEGTKAAGKYGYENAGNIARYAPIAANALQLAQLKKPQGERLDRLSNRYKPEYVDEAQLQNIANQTMNNSINAIGQSGASQGQLRSSIIGSQLQRTKALSDAYNQAAAQNRATNDRAQTFNLGVDQVNLQQSNSEKDINARNQGAYDTEKSKLIGKIGENIGSVGTEQAYKKIALTTTGYSWLGEFQKMNPNATKEETILAAKKAGVVIDDDKTTKKNALGGYLIKNKVK